MSVEVTRVSTGRRQGQAGSAAVVRAGALAAIVAVYLVATLADRSLPFFDDELGYYVPRALEIFDSRAMWRTALNGLVMHPTLMELSFVGLWKAVGYSLTGTRVLSAGYGAIALMATAAAAFRVGGTRASVGSVLLMGTSPLFFFHSRFAIPEALVTLCVALALYALFAKRLWLLVLASSGAALAKPTALVILPALAWGLYRLRSRSTRDRFNWAPFLLLIPVGVVVAWQVTQLATPGVELIHNTAGGAERGQLAAAVDRLGDPYRIAVGWLLRGLHVGYFDFRWIASLAIVGLSASIARGWYRRNLTPSLSRALPMLAVLFLIVLSYVAAHGVVGPEGLPRYLLPCFPAFAILSAVALDSLLKRWYWPSVVGLSVLYLSVLGGPSYQLGPFHMGAWNDHATYRPMVRAYQESFAFVENRCPTAVIAGNYPATTMARDPRLGYVRAPHRSEPLAARAPDAAGGRPVYVVAGDQLTPVPAWVRDGSTGRRWTFGEDRSTVWVIGPAGSSPCP